MRFLDKYKPLLRDKLVVHDMIPREEVICELSKMDFLINLGKLSELHVPRKLFDYGLAKRPIYSFNQMNFSVVELTKFFNAVYNQILPIDLKPFYILNVSKQYLQLSGKH